MKLHKVLSQKQFVLFNFTVLFAGLIFLAVLYYILNIQYQKPVNSFTNGPVTTPPKSLTINLETPEDNSLVFTKTLPVSGHTEHNMTVLVFTDTNNSILEVNADGSFSAQLDLDEGENRITAVAFDNRGESRSLERTVYYSKEKI